MKRFLILVFAVFASLAAVGQDSACIGRACQSFKELAGAKASAVVESLTRETALVCFSPTEDRFFIVSFNTPTWSSWLLETKKRLSPGEEGGFSAYGGVRVEFFQDGISEQGPLGFPYSPSIKSWRAWGRYDSSFKPEVSGVTFGASCTAGAQLCSLTIDDNEIQLMESLWHHHTVTVRRSTKRFVESIGDETTTGACQEFKNSAN